MKSCKLAEKEGLKLVSRDIVFSSSFSALTTVEAQDALGQVGLFTVGENEIDQPHLHYEVWQGDEVGVIHEHTSFTN